MSLVETIATPLRLLSVREQIEAALRQDRLNPDFLRQREESMRLTHGVFDEVDGEIFEQALRDSRRVEDHA